MEIWHIKYDEWLGRAISGSVSFCCADCSITLILGESDGIGESGYHKESESLEVLDPVMLMMSNVEYRARGTTLTVLAPKSIEAQNDSRISTETKEQILDQG